MCHAHECGRARLHVFVFVFVCLFVCLSVCLSVRPSVRPSVRLSVCLCVGGVGHVTAGTRATVSHDASHQQVWHVAFCRAQWHECEFNFSG